ncbi:hypothetical protein BKD30_14205 [Tersicoccus phoenicis]|uniref:Short-chain dehydrogenase/reductase n=1 Tax=Tersicoccus phoenicis TaxID=554083 RepID=A0A1R1L663_9MICC|nr:hypothetical protein BKD30_14205 [Tersicoccus phoenicis]
MRPDADVEMVANKAHAPHPATMIRQANAPRVAFPTVGAYHVSKWALEGFLQSLAQEVAGFNIKVTLVEPGGFSTDWSGPSAKRSEQMDDYAEVREAAASRPSENNPGDPTATRGAILKVVDTENPHLRIFFGAAPLDIATKDYESRLATWNEWQPVSIEAHGNEVRDPTTRM